jgi:hypothetical protein
VLCRADRFVSLPDALSRWCLYAGLGAALTAALYAAILAFVASFEDMDTGVDDLLGPPRKRRVDGQVTLDIPERPRHRDMLALLAWRVRMFGVRLRISTVTIARSTLNGILTLVYGFQVVAVLTANWIHRRVRLLGRRVRYVVVGGSACFWVGCRHAARGLVYAWRPALAYLGVVGAAVLAIALSDGITRYLVDGPLAALGAGVGWSLLAVAVCFAAVERLSSEATRNVARAQFRLVERAIPDLAIFIVAVGWLVGIPGSLGYGPIRVGWVTVGGTVVLLTVMANETFRARREGARRVAPPATG